MTPHLDAGNAGDMDAGEMTGAEVSDGSGASARCNFFVRLGIVWFTWKILSSFEALWLG